MNLKLNFKKEWAKQHPKLALSFRIKVLIQLSLIPSVLKWGCWHKATSRSIYLNRLKALLPLQLVITAFQTEVSTLHNCDSGVIYVSGPAYSQLYQLQFETGGLHSSGLLLKQISHTNQVTLGVTCRVNNPFSSNVAVDINLHRCLQNKHLPTIWLDRVSKWDNCLGYPLNHPRQKCKSVSQGWEQDLQGRVPGKGWGWIHWQVVDFLKL